MKTCVFAGTFDPITVGHKAAIEKILKEKRKVLIVVGENPDKTPYFTEDEREAMVRATFKGVSAVRVVKYSTYKDGFSGFLNSLGVTEYFRGIRNAFDYEFERAKESGNAEIYPNVKTVYIFPSKFKEVSSSAVRERIKNGKDVKRFIPKKAYPLFRSILKNKD